MKKVVRTILLALAVMLGATTLTAPAAQAYSVTNCHWRGATDFRTGYYTKYKVLHKNFSGWEEWTGQGTDGYYVVYKISPLRSGAVNEWDGSSYPRWGTWLSYC